ADSASVTLSTTTVPVPGYPHPLKITVTYALDDDGLTWTIEAENLGDDAAPYGCAVHPYLTAGPGRADDWSLTLPATEYLETIDDQLRPGRRLPVDGTELDFTQGRSLRSISCDLPFTGLQRGSDGIAEARL